MIGILSHWLHAFSSCSHDMRIRLRIALLMALTAFSAPSWSQYATDVSTGFYAGGGVGISNVYSYTDSYCYGCWGSSDYGDNDTAFMLTGGYRFSPYFAIEASYLDSGTPEWDEDLVYLGDLNDTYNVDAKIDLTSYQLSVLGILPFAEVWEVYLRGGLAAWEGDSSQILTRAFDNQVTMRNIDESGASFLLGVGGGVTFADRWHMRLDYVYFSIDDDLLALRSRDEAYSDIASLQIFYKFGRNL